MSDANDAPWLVGAGIADVTGEPWNVGLMGYGMRFQRSAGIHLRQRSRAFMLGDRDTDSASSMWSPTSACSSATCARRCSPSSTRALYGADNVVLTATHTHAGVGGYSCYRLYNMTTDGFRPHTYRAIVDGVLESIRRGGGRPRAGPARAGKRRAARRERQPLTTVIRAEPGRGSRRVPGRGRPDDDVAATGTRRPARRRDQLVRHARHEPDQPQPARQRRQQGLRRLPLGAPRRRRRLPRRHQAHHGLRADQRRRHVTERARRDPRADRRRVRERAHHRHPAVRRGAQARDATVAPR